MQSKVSILIPVYNREKIIIKTIESALSQTYENIEIIIVDNCSTDKTYDICKEYENKDTRVKVYKNEENIGPVKNWIECLKYSTGEYVKFLWSDDWMDNDFIEKTIYYLKDENIAFAYSPAYIVDENNKKLMYNLFDDNKIYDSNVFENLSILGGNVPVSPGCTVFRRKDVVDNLMIEISNADSLIFNKFGAGNDLLLFLLPLIKYKKVAYINSTKSYFRAHKQSFSCSNNLELYYDWARVHYLSIAKNKRLTKKFKTKIFVKNLFSKRYNNINKEISSKIDLEYLITKCISKLICKFKL